MAEPAKRDPFQPPDPLELIDIPEDLDTQRLAGMIFAEADARRAEDDERWAIGWCIINAVNHTNNMCNSKICAQLTQHQRDFI